MGAPLKNGARAEDPTCRLLRTLALRRKPLPLSVHAETEALRVPRFLRKHAKGEKGLHPLLKQLEGCSPAAPCESGACPRCIGLAQAWLSREGARFVRRNRKLGPWVLLSWVPPGQDGSLDLVAKKRWFERELRSAGVGTAIGGIDISWNVDKRVGLFPPHREGWALQLWAVVRKAESEAAEKWLKSHILADEEVPRPVRADEFDGSEAGFAYILKPNFVQRQTIETPRMVLRKRPGMVAPVVRGKKVPVMMCRNTRHDDLTVAMKQALYPALDRAGIGSRLILIGCQLRWTKKGPRIKRRKNAAQVESVSAAPGSAKGTERRASAVRYVRRSPSR